MAVKAPPAAKAAAMQASGKKGRPHRWAELATAVMIPVFAVCVYYIFFTSQTMADAVVSRFMAPAHRLVGGLFDLVPFCVMEWLYAGLILFAAVFVIRTVILIRRSGTKLGTLVYRVGILCAVGLWLFCVYLWMWGVSYNSTSFSERSGVSNGPVETDDLYRVTEYFVKNAAAHANDVPRLSDGTFAADEDRYFARSVLVYNRLSEEFPTLSGTVSRAPKKIFFSKIMSYMGFTGIYFPFTCEACINVDSPPCLVPATIAHELAHQKNVSSEQEANFLSVAACLSSGDDVFVYSGYLSGSIYLMNALYLADYDRWAQLYDEIQGGMLTDWNENNEYWKRFESPITDSSAAVYDTFLKANGQEKGIASYGACVDMLVNYYKDRI